MTETLSQAYESLVAIAGDPDRLYDLAMKHQTLLATVVALVVILGFFRRIWLRALLLLGFAALYATEEPDIWVWPYIAGLICLSVLTAGRGRRDISSKAEAYHLLYRSKVETFYREHAPEKLAELDKIMLKYRGNERLLWEKLQKKYSEPDERPAPKPAQPAPNRFAHHEQAPTVSPVVARAREEARREQEERLKQRLTRSRRT